MNECLPAVSSDQLPALVAAGNERAHARFLEFFASNIRNPHTRQAYARTISGFLDWCEARRKRTR